MGKRRWGWLPRGGEARAHSPTPTGRGSDDGSSAVWNEQLSAAVVCVGPPGPSSGEYAHFSCYECPHMGKNTERSVSLRNVLVPSSLAACKLMPTPSISEDPWVYWGLTYLVPLVQSFSYS